MYTLSRIFFIILPIILSSIIGVFVAYVVSNYRLKSPLLLYSPDTVITAYCEIAKNKNNIEEYLNSIANLIYEMRIDIGIIKNPKKHPSKIISHC